MKIIALLVGKIIYSLMRLIGREGGALPGNIALRICPRLLKNFKYPKLTILVTGTNGKTSTANMMAQVIAKSGIKVINNIKGDNIDVGIASMLIKNSNLTFKIKTQALVIEIDELTLARYIKDIRASHIIINNFFRDQLDRAGEMENIISSIERSIQNFSGKVILNADDPNVYRISKKLKYAKVITYGIEKQEVDNETDHVKEGKFCPFCDGEIKYDYYQYSHIGSYFCNNCDFRRIEPDYIGTNVDLKKGCMTINNKIFNFNISTLYHLYNCMAVYALISEVGIDINHYNNIVSNFILELGRMEKINDTLLNLIKNPTGANEVLRIIKNDNSKKTILFMLNDGIADGKDVSWIWDMDVSKIDNIENIICTGTRAYEIAIRFKYEYYKNISVEPLTEDAVKKLLTNNNTTKYAISNYTGLFELRKEIINGYKNSMDV